MYWKLILIHAPVYTTFHFLHTGMWTWLDISFGKSMKHSTLIERLNSLPCWLIQYPFQSRGVFPIGVSKYLFWPGTTLAHRITSTHHLWTIPLVLWASQGCHPLSLILSYFVVSINVLLSKWLTPISICFSGMEKQEVTYMNINLSHELWTDIKFGFLLAGEELLPYLIRLQVGWFLCNTAVFGFLYMVSTLAVQ